MMNMKRLLPLLCLCIALLYASAALAAGEASETWHDRDLYVSVQNDVGSCWHMATIPA